MPRVVSGEVLSRQSTTVDDSHVVLSWSGTVRGIYPIPLPQVGVHRRKFG